MERLTPHDLWEEAKQQLRRDIGEEEWKTFTMQSAQGGTITISETIQSLEAASNQASTRYRTHKVKTSGGKELFEYNVGRILTRLDMMFQMVDSTMSYAPQLASVVWTAFRMLFNCFLIHKEACDFLSGIVDRISYAIFICDVFAKRHLAKAPGGNVVAGVVKRVPGVYAAVLHFAYETKRLEFANPVKRIMDLMFGELKKLQSYVATVEAKLDDLEKCADISFKETVEEFIKDMGKDVKLVANLMPEMAQSIQRLEQSNQRIEENIKIMAANQGKSNEEKEREKLEKDHENALKWLKPGAWLLDSSQLKHQHNHNLESMSPGSCDWIFDHESYKVWLEKGNPRIMWLFGEAGFGKSFISSAVIDAIQSVNRLQQSDQLQPLIVYFFCRSGNDASQKSDRIMLHLLMQLFDHSSPERLLEKSKGMWSQYERGAIQKCIDVIKTGRQRLKDSEASQASDHTARRLGITDMQKLFGNLAQSLRRDIYIILDGLDECNDWSDRSLLNVLMGLTEGEGGIHLMITSRPEPSIESAFWAKPAHTWCYIEANKEHNGPGIAFFVDEELQSVKHLNEPQRHMGRNAIMKISEGKFRYTSAVVQTLKPPKSAAPFNKIMQNLPRGMDDFYRQWMQGLDSEYRNWLVIALRWLVCGEGLISAEPIADEIQGRYGLEELTNHKEYCENSLEDKACQEGAGICQQKSPEEADCSFYPVLVDALKQHARQLLKVDSHDTIAIAHGSVRDWIIRDAQEVERLLDDKMHLCPSCKDRQRRESTFEAGPKWGHLMMANNTMLTLNNREFQKKYGLLDDENGALQTEDPPKSHADEHATSKDGSCEQVKEVRAEQGLGPAFEERNDNVEEIKSTETQDFANFRTFGVGQASSEHTDTHEQQISNASLATDSTSEAAVISNEEGPMRDDATDAGAEEGGEYQYDNIEDPTSHLRYEITHWHYHVRAAEAAWPEEERQAHPHAAQLFDELYEQLDVFMQEGSLPFVQWQKRIRPDIFADFGEEADKELLVEGPVQIAARYDLAGMLRRYIATGTADLHRKNFFGNTPLHIASCGNTGFYVGSHAVLNLLLEASNPPINQQNHLYGESPLILAMNGNMPESFVKALLEAGARPELPDNDGYTALHWAAARRSLPLCQLLLEGREDVVDINARDSKGETPLHWLLKGYNSSYEVAEYLINCGANVRAEDSDSQQPLFEACSTSNTAIARLLIARGADVDDPETIFGWTALHAAVAEQNLELVKLLVDEGGATILVRDQKLRTPIAQAAELGNAAILEFLLKVQEMRSMEKRDLKKKEDEATETSEENRERGIKQGEKLKQRTIGGDGGDGMDFLLDPDIDSQTPLHRAAAKGLQGCVRLLVERSRDAKLLCAQRNRHGATPLHSAARRGHANVVKMLADIVDDADIAALNNDGRTPLACAVEGWRTGLDDGNVSWSDIIIALWQRSPTLPQGERLELLGCAIEKGVEDVCRLLLDLVHVEDENGCTPQLLAIQEGRQNIIDLLSHVSPSCWGGVDKISCLNVSEDGLELFGTATAPAPKEDIEYSWQLQSVRANCPIGPGRDRYYYEVTVVGCENAKQNYWVAIGFCSKYALLDGIVPGWSECNFPSWAYHGDDGCKFSQATYSTLNYPDDMKYGEPYGQGDIVGAGVDFANRVMFFTKNGARLEDAWVGDSIKGRLFPVVGMPSKGVRVRANFGSTPFKYNWERYEKAKTD